MTMALMVGISLKSLLPSLSSLFFLLYVFSWMQVVWLSLVQLVERRDYIFYTAIGHYHLEKIPLNHSQYLDTV
jgi:hypothetical protein